MRPTAKPKTTLDARAISQNVNGNLDGNANDFTLLFLISSSDSDLVEEEKQEEEDEFDGVSTGYRCSIEFKSSTSFLL